MTGRAGPTARQGQVLAYIHLYTKVNRRPPAEADVAGYFGLTPPSAHEMLVRLERAGFIARQPGAARSVRVLVPPSGLPELEDPPGAG